MLFVSVCIPVFETERFLSQCLRSVFLQDFDSFEVIVLSDASRGKDEKGWNCKKITNSVYKDCSRLRKLNCLQKVKLRFFENNVNRGLFEVRRTLVQEADGQYISMVDSDDVMEEGALKAFYIASKLADYDIIHGTSTSGVFNEEGAFIPTKENRYGSIIYNEIKGRDIFSRWLLKQDFTGTSWGKLIKRKLFVKAFECIPYTECNMAEDFLLFFFLSQYAKSYIGIKDKVYRYRVTSGMSSVRIIDSLNHWKMICSTASVFNIISTWIKAEDFTALGGRLFPEEIEYVQKITVYYLWKNLQQLETVVVPELKNQAHKMLCEYWGESFVNRVEASLDKAGNDKASEI